MTPFLLNMLRDPEDGSALTVKHPRYDKRGNISHCILESKNGNTYAVRNGIPRFTGERERVRTMVSDSEKHSEFHQNLYKESWLNEYVKHTFGSTDIFKNEVVIDCGGGTGYQGKWMIDNGAKHVIILENSQHVDGITRELMETHENIDIVQCSLEALPFEPKSFSGLITCNDVLQHTPSFDNSLKSLWGILGYKGEIVVSCPVRQCQYWYHKARYRLINVYLRHFLSTCSPSIAKQYARFVSLLYLIPGMDYILLKNNLVHRTTRSGGHLCMVRRYKDAFHHTFEYFAGHKHEHIKTVPELQKLVLYLQANPLNIKNNEYFFKKNRPLGVALRIKRSI